MIGRMSRRTAWLFFSASTLLILLLASQLPINQWRVVTFGIDSFETHIPLFGNRTITQTVDAQYPLTGIGFILVDLHRSHTLSDVLLTATTSRETTQATIPASTIQDDTFSRVLFPKPLNDNSEEITFTLQAPQVSPENAIGVRFEKRGTFALEIRERAPAWMIITHAFERHQTSWHYAIPSILATVLLIAAAFRIGWSAIPSKYHHFLEWAVITILLLAALWPRLQVMSRMGGASGGDPYNYLFIAHTIADGNNPLSGEKRLPGFPLLLVPSLISQHIDQIAYMRYLSIGSAIISLLLLFYLARVLKLPWSVQIMAPALIAWQKDFFWTSLRPEPYTFYTALLLSALVLFFCARHWWQQLLYGFVLGYAAMTRQEGFLLAAIMGIVSLLNWKVYVSPSTPFFSKSVLITYLRLYLPALLLVTPFFLNNITSYGNPFFTPYFEGDRLQIVDSWGAFTDSLGATWGILGSLWRPSWESLERYQIDNPLLLAGFFGTLLWVAYWHQFSGTQKRSFWIGNLVVGVIISIMSLMLTLFAVSSNVTMPAIVAGSIAASAITFMWVVRLPAIAMILVALSQIGVATWFHPFTKHYQQSLPLISLTIITTVLAPVIMRWRANQSTTYLQHAAIISFTLALLMPFACLTAKTLSDVNIMIDKHNASSAHDSVTYRAVKEAIKLPGPYGADQGYNQARLYFGDQGRYYLAENSTFTEEVDWVKSNSVHVMITTTDGDAFSHSHPTWQQIAHFRSEGKNERLYESFVYLIPTP